ncbi:hypothetical protein BTVI_146817 [Pitangus sulphuratus]|nr:hypothetical protein BTVI_146817 [Pitangus sulphuratus]
MAVGSVKMPSPCEGAELARSWNPGGGAHEPPPPVQLRQKLRELPALLRSGLTLRRKSAAAAGRWFEFLLHREEIAKQAVHFYADENAENRQ